MDYSIEKQSVGSPASVIPLALDFALGTRFTLKAESVSEVMV